MLIASLGSHELINTSGQTYKLTTISRGLRRSFSLRHTGVEFAFNRDLLSLNKVAPHLSAWAHNAIVHQLNNSHGAENHERAA